MSRHLIESDPPTEAVERITFVLFSRRCVNRNAQANCLGHGSTEGIERAVHR